jgi:hypothetical protein
VSVWSVWVPSTAVATTAISQGTMSSSWSVENTIGSFSVRGVATCVPGGIDSVVGWAADSQNVIGVRAAVGGRSRTPSRSRNFT